MGLSAKSRLDRKDFTKKKGVFTQRHHSSTSGKPSLLEIHLRRCHSTYPCKQVGQSVIDSFWLSHQPSLRACSKLCGVGDVHFSCSPCFNDAMFFHS